MRNQTKVHELEFLPSILDLIRLDCFINRGKFSVFISKNKPKSEVLYWWGAAGGMGGYSSKKSFFPSSLPNALFQNSLYFLIFSDILSPKLQ